YMVVDGRFVQTGSFNYNDHAEHDNAENLLVLESPTLAAAYLKDWEQHREHAVSYLKMSEQSEK
ncbi:MAG: phospholipase D-like domain-containing protein, partial [Sutterella sp.]